MCSDPHGFEYAAGVLGHAFDLHFPARPMHVIEHLRQTVRPRYVDPAEARALEHDTSNIGLVVQSSEQSVFHSRG